MDQDGRSHRRYDHRDLLQMARDGQFREDLYYRLSGATLRGPALRERASDIPLLIERFVREAAPDRRKPLQVTRDAMEHLVAHDWPGNVRELRSEVHRWLVFAEGTVGMHFWVKATRLVQLARPPAGSSTPAERA